MKRISNSQRLSYLKQKYFFTHSTEYNCDERHALNMDEINLMKNDVDFQSHTVYHPILTACSDDESEKEILQSKNDIEKLTKRKCKHFAYPNGNYSQREIEILQKAGYLSARTTDLGFNDKHVDPFRLKAIGIADDASINWLAIQSSGIVEFLKLKYNNYFKKLPKPFK